MQGCFIKIKLKLIMQSALAFEDRDAAVHMHAWSIAVRRPLARPIRLVSSRLASTVRRYALAYYTPYVPRRPASSWLTRCVSLHALVLGSAVGLDAEVEEEVLALNRDAVVWYAGRAPCVRGWVQIPVEPVFRDQRSTS